jgi:predicted dinucleotide-binding enzyme
MRIGIIGAGMIGSTLAKLWVDAGHDVRLASRHPEELQPVVERLGERASAGAPQDAAAFGEVVLLTVPLKAVPDLARDLAPLLVGKVYRRLSGSREGVRARHAALQHRHERAAAADPIRSDHRAQCSRTLVTQRESDARALKSKYNPTL